VALGFLTLVSFFTRIPVGRRIEYKEENFKKALSMYSLLGAVIGFFLVLTYLLFNNIYIDLIRGLVVTLCYVVITGGIHIDGAADTSDGIFSGRTGDRIFEIMSDSHIGAFGVLSIVIIVVSQVILFSYIDIYSCFMVPVTGRACVIAASWNKKYAKKTKGMGTLFVESINTRVLISNMALLFLLCILMPNRTAIAAAAFGALAASYFISCKLEDLLGGMTGDTCGFIAETSQIIFMILVLFLQGQLWYT